MFAVRMTRALKAALGLLLARPHGVVLRLRWRCASDSEVLATLCAGGLFALCFGLGPLVVLGAVAAVLGLMRLASSAPARAVSSSPLLVPLLAGAAASSCGLEPL
eukprot:Amastigsp_a845975_43.p3 type:complete len:105 gc:universal Amastigsp_a845975_43:432-118(-)